MNGARLCRNLSAFGGMKSSLKMVFKPSAAGCSKPARRKPTRGSSRMLIRRVQPRRTATERIEQARARAVADGAHLRRRTRSRSARGPRTAPGNAQTGRRRRCAADRRASSSQASKLFVHAAGLHLAGDHHAGQPGEQDAELAEQHGALAELFRRRLELEHHEARRRRSPASAGPTAMACATLVGIQATARFGPTRS